MHHVILGNGPAGVLAAEDIRKYRPDDRITLVGDESEPPYSRMALPYLLVGDIGESGTWLRDAGDHFRAARIDLICARANVLDADKKTVTLSDGNKLLYDKLLLATGSRPVRPPIPGIDLPRVLSCWTLADARAIQEQMRPGARILQMGAGFIGCIIMKALAACGKLTVVEMGDRVVPRMMTPIASRMIERWCGMQGVEILTATQVTGIEDKGPLVVRFGNGTRREFDIVICATGVKPAVDYLRHSKVKIGPDGGIVVDERMRTTAPDVYAAGDCTEAADFSTGQHFVNAIQPDAADQALVAARNMAGQPAAWEGAFRMNVLETFGLISSSFGQWWGAEGGQSIEASDEAAFKYLRLELKGDFVIGATSVGLTEHVGVLRGLIQSRARLTPAWRQRLLIDPHKFVDAYLACAQSAA